MTLATAAIGGSRLGDLGRAAVLLSSSTAASRLVGFLGSLAGAALLGAVELGMYAFMLATASLLGAFGVLGFGPLVTRAVAAAESPARAALSAAFVLRTTGVLLAGAVGVFLVVADPAVGIVSVDAITGRTAVLTVAAWSVFAGLNPVLVAVFAGHRAFRTVGKVTLTRAVAVAVGSVLGALITPTAVSAAVGATAGEGLAFVATGVVLWRRGLVRGGLRDGWHRGGRTMMRGAVGAGLASCLIQLAVWGSQAALLDTPEGLADNGGFALAQRLTLVVAFVPNAIATASLPHLTGDFGAERTRRAFGVLSRATAVACVFAFLVAAGAFLFLDRVGRDYEPYVSTAVTMAVAGVLISANNVLGSLAVAAHRLRPWVASDVLLATTLMAAALPLVARLGADGLALAYLLAYGVSAAFLACALRRRAGRAASGAAR